MSDGTDTEKTPPQQSSRQVFLRGLAISLPAILTIVILLWLINGISDYIIEPTTAGVKWTIARFIDQSIDVSHPQLSKLDDGPALRHSGENYLVAERLNSKFRDQKEIALSAPDTQAGPGGETDGEATTTSILTTLDRYFTAKDRTAEWLQQQAIERPDPTRDPAFKVYVPLGGRAVPYPHYVAVAQDTPASEMPATATRLYMEYAVRSYVGSAFTLSVLALSLVILAIYFLGRVVSVRLGSWVVSQLENRLLARVPVIRNVYGSAKQVTDFLFSESQVEYRRVVAIEYPRRGIWSLGLVTGEGMLEITSAIGEPCLSILVPSSPMPVTGYTMLVPRSAVMDVNLTVDQAFQFCISCGVLVPGHQKVTPEVLERELTKRLAERMRESPGDRRPYTLPAPLVGSDDEDGGDR